MNLIYFSIIYNIIGINVMSGLKKKEPLFKMINGSNISRVGIGELAKSLPPKLDQWDRIFNTMAMT